MRRSLISAAAGFAAAILLVALAGCDALEKSHAAYEALPRLEVKVHRAGDIKVHEYHLPDGTRCITVGVYQSTTCDWRRP